VDSMRYICGSIWMVQDKNDEAKEQLLEALELTRNIKYRNGEIYILRQLGILARRRRHYTTATKYYLESLEIARRAESDAENEDERVNAKNSMAQALNNLGTAAMAERAYDDAAGYFKERLKIAIELNNQEGKLFAYLSSIS
jgi:tetratricopeptide (TPR) repeat protein